MFITFEGGDGSGKSTMAKKLADWLGLEKGKTVVLTREPRSIFRKTILRNVKEVTPRTELMLFLADRASHWDKTIKPSLDAGAWVICDRFSDSTVAYQAYGKGVLGHLVIDRLNKEITQYQEPDITFYLRLDPAEGLKRATDPNKFRKAGLEFHKRVHEGYEAISLVNPNRIKIIDASKSPDEVFNEIKSYIEPILKKENEYADRFKA